MPKMQAIKDGLEIFLKYKPEGYCDAQHDVLYADCHPTPGEVSDEDRAALEKLGWLWDEEVDSWMAFT